MKGQFNQPFKAEQILGLKSSKKLEEIKGFFIEAGAAEGEEFSNTLYYETKYGWTGLLVEPNPEFLKQLYSKHRSSYILPHCLSTKNEVEVVNFEINDLVSKMVFEDERQPQSNFRKIEVHEIILAYVVWHL